MNTFSTTQPTTTNNIARPAAIIAVLLGIITIIWVVTSSGLLSNRSNELSNAVTTWESEAIDSYTFDLQVSCFCFPDMTRAVTIVVADNAVQSVTYVDDGSAADPTLFAAYSTVDKLFERLENAQAENPVTFDVTFDAKYGAPQSVFIDIDEMMADEEIMFTVSNFEVLSE